MDNIREARKAQGLTQEQLAELIGVTQGTVAQWENGLTHPSFEKIPKVANALGITVEELLKAG